MQLAMKATSFLLYLYLISMALASQCGACSAGWQSMQEETKCFAVFNESKNWNNAEATCKNHSGHLASVTSKVELQFMQTLCGNESIGCWLGGHGANSSIGFIWRWSDDHTHWNSSLLQNSCAQSRCTQTKLCTFVTYNRMDINVDNCHTLRPFACTTMEASKCQHKSCHKEYNVILAVVSVFIFMTTCGVVVWLLLLRQTKRWRRSSSSANAALMPPSWRVFTFSELRAATKNFSDGNKLGGDNRSGRTYKGVLTDGSLVAIKRLSSGNFKWKEDFLSQKKLNFRSLNEQEFLSEIGRIARYRHPNLVTVRGCCFKHGQKYIVYDFMPNGPLDRWLHHLPRGAKSLDWIMRMRIAVTLAQGIAFLHDKVRPHVVHRDIRSSNVLLDEEFRAHILGVGLAKFVPWETMNERTAMAGTYGYLAPEFVYRNELTTKSDVFSFGVLLLELISGRMPFQTVESVDWQSIFEWATPLVQSNNFVQLLDPVITSVPDVKEIQKVVNLVYSCTQHVPSMRPRMSYVVHQLQLLPSLSGEAASLAFDTLPEATESMSSQ
ncbi:hypothetical protein GOP47_0017627 [Adiantum capillus-veneris]|uniref:C-type lectin receptor-like tyrosine-protein kinase At1g52310 n=1 Tax=Adiantum capillus-veneris TaxID=13818 RepID=A0A9D4UFR3_ADICA|nr:hypothetical protein GOP47_0017627 [Adiantum capillus-veneris]